MEEKKQEETPERPYFLALTKEQIELLLACIDIAQNSRMEDPELSMSVDLVESINQQTGIY